MVGGGCRASIVVLAVAAVATVVGACNREEPGPPGGPGAAESEDPGPGTVRFEGGEFEGTIYLLAGQDSLNADLYRARGSLDEVERLTAGGRVSTLTANGEAVVVANARGAGSDRVEVADLDAEEALPGRVIDRYGQAPDLAESGKLLYIVPQYTKDGGDAGDENFVTTAEPGAPKRSVMRTPTNDTLGWAPGEELGLLRDGARRLVVRPGSPSQRTIDSGFPHTRFGFMTSSRGDVLFYGPGKRVAIVRPDGTRREIDSPWVQAGSWSPDGRSLLVQRGDRLGRMSAEDGSVVEIGRVSNGKMFTAEWEPEGAP